MGGTAKGENKLAQQHRDKWQRGQAYRSNEDPLTCAHNHQLLTVVL
jgi:hypothetical protein